MSATPSPSASHSPATPCSAAARSSPRADAAGDGRGRAVGEEVEDAERRGQHRPGDRQPGERPRAEVADDRGVGEDVERLRDERAEGREREPPDLTIVGVAAEQRGPAHPPTLCGAHEAAQRTGLGEPVSPGGLNRIRGTCPDCSVRHGGAPTRRGRARGRAHGSRVPHTTASPRSPAYDPSAPGWPGGGGDAARAGVRRGRARHGRRCRRGQPARGRSRRPRPHASLLHAISSRPNDTAAA